MALVPLNVFQEYARQVVDPKRDPRLYRAIVVMLSSIAVGTRPTDIARYTGYPLESVSELTDHLKMAGIFGDVALIANPLDARDPGGDSERDHEAVHAKMIEFASVALGDITLDGADPMTARPVLTQQGRQLARDVLYGEQTT